MARGSPLQFDLEKLSPKELEAFNRKRNRELAGLTLTPGKVVANCIIGIVLIALVAGVLGIGQLAWSWGRNHLAEVILLGALLLAAGYVWLLIAVTDLTAALTAWIAVTACGWILGSAIGGLVGGIAGAVLIGVTVAPAVAVAVLGLVSAR